MPSNEDLQQRLQADLAPDLEILRPLGRGSAARVFLAREPGLKRLVALKVLRPDLAADEVMRGRFEREAESIARIAHPGVAAVHRIGRLQDGVPYMVLEYIDGRTVADAAAAGGPLPVERACEILASVASALAAAHERGIVHRDLRPGNVLVENRTGRAVLVDFGIAALIDAGADAARRLTGVGETVGDIRYMSPEQLRGEPVTGQSDVFSFGLLAYELLTGRSATEGASLPQIASSRIKGEHPPIRVPDRAIPPAIADLVERCLATEPDRRPHARDIAARLASPGTVDTHESVGGFLHELKRRRVYQVLAAYAVVSFGVLQAADLVLPVLPLPEGSYKVLVVLTLAGFPLALVLSWMYDVGRSGIERTETEGPGRGVLPWVGLAASILIAAVIGWAILR